MGCLHSMFSKVKYEKVKAELDKEIEMSEMEIDNLSKELETINNKINLLVSKAKPNKAGKRIPSGLQVREMKMLMETRNMINHRLLKERKVRDSFYERKLHLTDFVRNQKMLDSMSGYKKIVKTDVTATERKANDILDNEGNIEEANAIVEDVFQPRNINDYEEGGDEQDIWNSDYIDNEPIELNTQKQKKKKEDSPDNTILRTTENAKVVEIEKPIIQPTV